MEAIARPDHAFEQSRLNPREAADLFAKRRESTGPTQPEVSESVPERSRPTLEESSAEVDSDPADVEAQDADSQEDSAESEETTGPLELRPDQVVKLPDGSELPVTELQRGFLREADYTQKTQALAEQRKVMDEAAQVMSFHLGTLRQQATAELQRFATVNWPDLFDKDPAEFQRQRLKYDAAKERVSWQQKAEQEFIASARKAKEAEAATRRKEALGYLTKNYPGGWSSGEYQSLLSYAQTHGWSQESVEQWDDPLVFTMLRKAKAFDEMTKAGTKKVVKSAASHTLKSTRGAAPRQTVEAQRKADFASTKSAPTRASALSQAAALLSNSRKARTR